MENLIEKEGNSSSRIIRSLLFFVGAAFVLALVFHGRHKLGAAISDADWNLFGASILLALASNFVCVLAFSAFLSKHGQDMSIGVAARMLMYGQIAKYIPGKIWGLLYQATHVDVALVTIKVVALTNLELMIVGIIANAAVAAGLIAFFSLPSLTGLAFLIGLLLCSLTYVYRGYQPLLRLLQKWMPKFGVYEGRRYSAKDLIYVGSYYVSLWLCYLAGALLMIIAVTDLSIQETAFIMAVMNVAWIVSILVFVFPAGIGIREVVFVWLTHEFATDVSIEQVAAIAVIFRFWQVMLDVLGAAIVWLSGWIATE